MLQSKTLVSIVAKACSTSFKFHVSRKLFHFELLKVFHQSDYMLKEGNITFHNLHYKKHVSGLERVL